MSYFFKNLRQPIFREHKTGYIEFLDTQRRFYHQKFATIMVDCSWLFPFRVPLNENLVHLPLFWCQRLLAEVGWIVCAPSLNWQDALTCIN